MIYFLFLLSFDCLIFILSVVLVLISIETYIYFDFISFLNMRLFQIDEHYICLSIQDAIFIFIYFLLLVSSYLNSFSIFDIVYDLHYRNAKNIKNIVTSLNLLSLLLLSLKPIFLIIDIDTLSNDVYFFLYSYFYLFLSITYSYFFFLSTSNCS